MASLIDVRPGTRTVAFARDLATHGDRPAVITDDGELTYRGLAERFTATAHRLGHERRLVLLAGANTVDALVVYLAALVGRHPILLVPGNTLKAARSLIEAYDPDVVAGPVAGEWVLDERRPVSAHALHPDLALLMSTSGSTGSPKLVRLSHANLQSNAESIARYLAIRPTDRAATTLPMHYCYGLSVINSHLLQGAALILTDLSVADSCFWERFAGHRATSFAGVPYTFELLDRIGFAEMRLPHLRYVTQAGGRLAPDRVAAYAALGRARGWDFFVMYGQTEATARMAYLPPDLAESHPQAIGVPVPGGSFRLEPLADAPHPDTGELVYRGPNVMLGYAESPADLGLGRTVGELHTGDVARRTPEGLYELVGRRSRFAKILGLRVDPQRVEALLERHGVTACCLSADDELVVAALGGDPAQVRRLVAAESGLPARAVRVHLLAELPRLATGKTDYEALRELTRRDAVRPPVAKSRDADSPGAAAVGAAPSAVGESRNAVAAGRPSGAAGVDLCQLYAEILDRSDVTPGHSFVDLGGDSLSYVEMSLRLEEALGHLPSNWHILPIRDLRPPPRQTRARRRVLETSVALRAIAIILVVGTHMQLFALSGGAHLLLGVAGFNFARFQLTDAGRLDRLRQICGGIARVAVPSMTWIGAAFLVTDDYRPSTVLLLNSLVGPDDGRIEWHFWFIEALVYILVGLAAVLAIPGVDRVERRFPFAFPLALMALGLVSRYDVFGLDARYDLPTAVVAFWLFALGWAAARAGGVRHRLVVTAAAAATIPGFFGQPQREALIMAGLALLIWVPTVPSVGPLNRLVGVVAGSSLYIYLTHWQVFPLLDEWPLLALAASLAVGVGYAALATRAGRWVGRRRRALGALAGLAGAPTAAGEVGSASGWRLPGPPRRSRSSAVPAEATTTCSPGDRASRVTSNRSPSDASCGSQRS